jgi:hypothetical protein
VLNISAFRARFLRHRVFMAAVAAVAFLVLVFGASTHVHADPNGEDGCAVHMAVVGKLEGPSSPPIAVPPASVVYLWQQPQGSPQIARAVPVVLPPSCGPPHLA